MGWNWVRQIAKFSDVWVLTRAANRQAIEQALRVEPISHVQWIYLDLPEWARKWKQGNRGIHLYYFLWQVQVYFKARRLHRDIRFDIAHHLTFVNYWLPSFLPLLQLRFVWGPVGGGESAPVQFRREFSKRGRIYEFARDLARMLTSINPLCRLSASRAVLGLSTTEETREQMIALGCPKVVVYSEAGLNQQDIDWLNDSPPPTSDKMRIVSLGRLLHWKGFHLGLRAFARFHRQYPDSEYWIVGSGPEEKRLLNLVDELGLHASVRFTGALPRDKALQKLKQCDVLLHPSLHDSGGWVCLEAMAARRPVVCLDLGGPGTQVTDNVGFKVPATNPQETVALISEALIRLTDVNLRCRMGELGKKRVSESFSWERKGEFLAGVYQQALSTEPVQC